MVGDDSRRLVRRNGLGGGTERVMFVSRNILCAGTVVTAAILLLASNAPAADDAVGANEDTSEDAIEEIIVYAYRSGDKIDMDARYEELLRSRAAAELQKMDDLNEEYEWRKSWAPAEDSSRIKWGYNPADEMDMRRDTTLTDWPTDTVRPATLFRAQF